MSLENALISYKLAQKEAEKLHLRLLVFSKKTGSRLLFNVDDLVVLPYNIADYRLFHTKGRTNQILVSAVDEKKVRNLPQWV